MPCYRRLGPVAGGKWRAPEGRCLRHRVGVDTSCMKALRRVKSFEGFLASFFFSKMSVETHTSRRAEEVLLWSEVSGDGREFSFHL